MKYNRWMPGGLPLQNAVLLTQFHMFGTRLKIQWFDRNQGSYISAIISQKQAKLHVIGCMY